MTWPPGADLLKAAGPGDGAPLQTPTSARTPAGTGTPGLTRTSPPPSPVSLWAHGGENARQPRGWAAVAVCSGFSGHLCATPGLRWALVAAAVVAGILLASCLLCTVRCCRRGRRRRGPETSRLWSQAPPSSPPLPGEGAGTRLPVGQGRGSPGARLGGQLCWGGLVCPGQRQGPSPQRRR